MNLIGLIFFGSLALLTAISNASDTNPETSPMGALMAVVFAFLAWCCIIQA